MDNWDHTIPFVTHFFKVMNSPKKRVEVRIGSLIEQKPAMETLELAQKWINEQIKDLRNLMDD